MLPSLILSSLLVCACGAPLSVETRPFDVPPTAHCLTVNDTDKTITFTNYELQNGVYTTIADTFNDDPTAYMTYSTSWYLTNNVADNATFVCNDYVSGDGIYFDNQELNYGYHLSIETGADYIGKWFYDTDDEGGLTIPNDLTITWHFGNTPTELFNAFAEDIEADNPSPSPSGAEVVTDIVSILVSGLTTLGTGIGSGVANFAQALAFDGDGLSVYFVLVLAFAGVSLAVGLTTKIFDWLSSLGN